MKQGMSCRLVPLSAPGDKLDYFSNGEVAEMEGVDLEAEGMVSVRRSAKFRPLTGAQPDAIVPLFCASCCMIRS